MKDGFMFRSVALWLAAGLTMGMLGALPQSVAAQGTPVPGAPCAVTLNIGMEGDACVQVIHASPDAPAVDVYVNGDLALEELEFGAASGWVALPAGNHQVQVTATGEAPDTAVIDATLMLDAGVAYEVAATGHLAEITPEVFVADLSELDSESARIRVVHTSPDAPAVDIAVTGDDILVENLSYPTASEYLTVPASSYDLEVRPTGTMDVALALPGVELEAGTVYDVFAIGLASDGSLNVLVIASPLHADQATPIP